MTFYGYLCFATGTIRAEAKNGITTSVVHITLTGINQQTAWFRFIAFGLIPLDRAQRASERQAPRGQSLTTDEGHRLHPATRQMICDPFFSQLNYSFEFEWADCFQRGSAGTDLQSDTDHVEGIFDLRVFGPVGEFLAQPDAQAAESHTPGSTK